MECLGSKSSELFGGIQAVPVSLRVLPGPPSSQEGKMTIRDYLYELAAIAAVLSYLTMVAVFADVATEYFAR